MTGVYRFVVLIVILVVLEAALVGAVVLVPDARQSLTQAAVDAGAVWSGSETRAGNFAVLGDAVEEFYQTWLRPLGGPPPVETAPAEFGGCVECHSSYASKTRFSTVLMDHPLHAELGVPCATCHTDVAHPLPLPPSEDVCTECHDETTRAGDPAACALCHPAGRLTHYQIAGLRGSAAVDCNTCHLPGTLGGEALGELIEHHRFDGADSAICVECHEPSDCAACHSADHPDDWITQHGPDVAYSSQASCNRCHSSQWCTGACHDAGTLLGDRLLPLPYGGDE